MSEIREKNVGSISGIPFLIVLILAVLAAGFLFITGISTDSIPRILSAVATFVISIFLMTGLYKVEPNQSAVLSLFGKYIGTVRTPGLWFNNPFYSK